MTKLKLIVQSVLIASCFNVYAEDVTKYPEMTVYRSPTCGCCGNWLEHVKTNHFAVKDVITEDMEAVKQRYGVPDKLASCHTAVVEGYVVEGHVPAVDIQKLLTEKPQVTGISAPGMPMGSPGMEMGDRKDAYQVMSFDKADNVKVFVEHTASE